MIKRRIGTPGGPRHRRWLLPLGVLVLVGQGLLAGQASAATVSVCTTPDDLYHTVSVGGSYQIQPDEWNSTQPVCMGSDGGPDFTVTSSALTTATNTKPLAPGAYPRIQPNATDFTFPTPVATMGDTLTSWSTTEPATGEYDVAYDIWYADSASGCSATSAYELMVWLKSAGGATPAGSALGPVTIDGNAYAVSGQGANTDRRLINYVRTAQASSVYDLNLRTITADAVTRGYAPAAGVLCSVQAGFEIWAGGAGLATTSFDYRPTTTLPSGNVTSGVPGKCLDGGDNAPASGANSYPADVWTCGTTAGQSWTVGNDGTVQALGKCLDVADGGTTNGTKVQLWPCNGTGSQTWREAGKGLLNPQSGLCLADPAQSTTNGTQLVLWTCGSTGQDWRYPYDGPQLWTDFTNAVANDCLSAAVESATSVSLHGCASPVTAAQNWAIRADGSLVSGSGLCLDAGTGTANGGPLSAASCSGGASQQWLLGPDGSLMNPATHLCADDPGSTATPGTALDAWTCNGTKAQTFWSAA